MNELVDRNDIQQYAIRNTSPQMPIEQKYVLAFLDALMNSTSVQYVYNILKEEMQNGNSFTIFNSYHKFAPSVNKEPYRSIVAYAMLKKDFRLFELISSSMFTGTVTEYHGMDLYTDTAFETDEFPTKYTDSGITTDMSEGQILIGFKNWYCDDPLPDGTGSEYQTLEELNKALEDFDKIITLTKPARVEILLFYVPYLFLSGTSNTILTCGIDRNDEEFTCPFGDPTSMNIIDNLQDNEFETLYSQVSMKVKTLDPSVGPESPDYPKYIESNKSIETTKEIEYKPNEIIFDYDFKTEATASSSEEGAPLDVIWGEITLESSIGGVSFARASRFSQEDADKGYYERYVPLMIKINQGDPDSPCIALDVEYIGSGDPTTDTDPTHWEATVGALFYGRDKV